MKVETAENKAQKLIDTDVETYKRWERETINCLPHLTKIITLFGDDKDITFFISLKSINVGIPNVNDVEVELKRIYPILRRAGYKAEEFDKSDLSWCWLNVEDTSIQVYVKLSLLNGGKCRRVQTGTREVPVFSIECDGVDNVEVPTSLD